MTPNEPQQQDLDEWLDEQREAGEVHRPPQVEATEDAEASVQQEREALR